MTTLHVIILAQGQQTRLPGLPIAKHLLEIPHAGETILGRTLRLLGELAPAAHITLIAPQTTTANLSRGGYQPVARQHGIHELVFVDAPPRAPFMGMLEAANRRLIEAVTLYEPGNHAVAGLQRFLRSESSTTRDVVVLLGDVIYSREAMWRALTGVTNADPVFTGVAFVGSPDLSPGTGELFAIRVSGKRRDVLLADVPKTSAAFTGYQPGRLRELLWELQKHHRVSWDLRVHARAPFIPIDDFTTDIDTPADLDRLPEIGLAVAREAP